MAPFLKLPFSHNHNKWASIFGCLAAPKTIRIPVYIFSSERRLKFEVVGQCASSAGQSNKYRRPFSHVHLGNEETLL